MTFRTQIGAWLRGTTRITAIGLAGAFALSIVAADTADAAKRRSGNGNGNGASMRANGNGSGDPGRLNSQSRVRAFALRIASDGGGFQR
jgi:hypothetical protein